MTAPVGSTPLAEKLRLIPGARCLTLGAPEKFFALLENLPPGITFSTKLSGQYEWAMLFASEIEQVIDGIPKILPLLVEDGLLWITYPKSSSKLKGGLKRQSLWNVMHSHGYKAVTQVYVDDDWTAMRFRQLELIGR